MYDVQTILSAYDKQGTLVQWLKNLDETLKTSGLESVNTIPVEGGYKLQFKFANGVVLESDTIQKITTLDIEADSVKLALTDANGVLVEYYSNLTVNGENVTSNIKLLLPIKGSESVIVDVDENGTAIEIHLDADILNDITSALKIPVGTISTTELVAITPSKEQKMLTVGNGLKIENDTLIAEATGGGLQLKQITFTDRPSLWTWLQENNSKVLKGAISIAELNREIIFSDIFYYANNYIITSFKIKSFGGLPLSSLGIDIIGFYISKIEVYYLEASLSLTTDEVTPSLDGNTQLEDSAWQLYGVTVKITYIE